ncbi:MAG: cyclic nucleotide-binding domain-containing protein [Oscillospiraceae bacterium]|nr:cyclic nucleotide-binding domain-containing protein [Oscillospiraceae bacterium]
MKESKQYRLNEIVFRQGDESVFMYRVLRGKVGLFLDYGSSDEVKLAELLENQIFGEMGLLDRVPRSATAVVLEEETELEAFTEEDASGFFEQNPESGMLLLMQMCSRLRSTTRRYVDVCHTVRDALDAETFGYQKNDELLARIAKYAAVDRERTANG